MLRLAFSLVTLFIAGCTAHFPVNPPLDQYDPSSGYRVTNMGSADNSKELLLYLTFSGGGTRAAALAYGVLEELDRTDVIIGGRRRRLLDEVDVISAVSGGSFTAAYYGVFGDRVFSDFERRFLKRNIDKALSLQLASPTNWARLVSAEFSRSDMVARYYDKHIFDGSTLGDIAERGGPAIVINATDMSLGQQFSFHQSQFDWICSDVSRVPVARAVAASSAVPVLFTAVTLRNYAGECGFQPPKWFAKALESSEKSTPRFEQAEGLSSYLTPGERPYIHLLDGGLSDNLGVRAPLNAVVLAGGVWRALREAGLQSTRKIVFIVVDAETESDQRWDQRKRAPKMKQVLDATTTSTLSRASLESLQLLRQNMAKWREEIRVKRCAGQRQVRTTGVTPAAACGDIDLQVVHVSFDALSDPDERDYLKTLPTSLHLPGQDVDRLRDAASQILAESPAYQIFLKALR